MRAVLSRFVAEGEALSTSKIAVGVNLAFEVVEPGLQFRSDILDGLILNCWTQRAQNQVDNLGGAKIAELFVELFAKQRL